MYKYANYGPPPSFWHVLDMRVKLRTECLEQMKIVFESVKKRLI